MFGIRPEHLCILLPFVITAVVAAVIAIRNTRKPTSSSKISTGKDSPESETPTTERSSDSETLTTEDSRESDIQTINNKQRRAVIIAVVTPIACCIMPTLSRALPTSITNSLLYSLAVLVIIFSFFGACIYSLVEIWTLRKRRQALERGEGVRAIEKTVPASVASSSSHNMSRAAWVFVIIMGVFIGLGLCVFTFNFIQLLVPKSSYHVRYYVTTSGGASIKYIDADGKTQQDEWRFQEWFREFEARSGTNLYLSVQDYSYIADCSISVDGNVLSSTRAHLATCMLTLP